MKPRQTNFIKQSTLTKGEKEGTKTEDPNLNQKSKNQRGPLRGKK
jgi:hypothetical protein